MKDSSTIYLFIIGILAAVILTIGLVFYQNKKDENQNFVQADQNTPIEVEEGNPQTEIIPDNKVLNTAKKDINIKKLPILKNENESENENEYDD